MNPAVPYAVSTTPSVAAHRAPASSSISWGSLWGHTACRQREARLLCSVDGSCELLSSHPPPPSLARRPQHCNVNDATLHMTVLMHQ